MARKEPRNEQALCKAIMRLIGQRRGEAITKTEPVDTVVRTRPAVDWRFETATARFALEHTRIESFPGQIVKGKKFAQLLGPFEAELSGRLPGTFYLTVGVGEAKAPTPLHKVIRRALDAWVVEHADSLDPEEDVGPSGNCDLTARPPGVPFQVKLHRDSSRGSELFIMQGLHGDPSILRRERIREALNRKCPKLLQEQIGGRRSILVLESDDVALANRTAIAEAAVAELSTRCDAPDIVVWARTSTHPWKALFIKDGSSMFPSVDPAGLLILDSTRGTA